MSDKPDSTHSSTINSSSGNGHAKPRLTPEQVYDLVGNAMLARSKLFERLTDTRRNINAECNYPDDPTPEMYKELYDREAVATRVVEVLPKESWQVTPFVYEDEDPETVTDFEEAWDTLSQSLHGENSWYQDEQGSPIWEHLKRADILSGVGHFGIVLLGIDDGRPLDQPAEGVITPMPGGVVGVKRGLRKGERITDNQGRHTGVRITNRGSETVFYWSSPRGVNPEEQAWIVNQQATLNQVFNQPYPTPNTYDSAYGGYSGYSGVQGTDAQYTGAELNPSESDISGSRRRGSAEPNKSGKSTTRNLLFVRTFDEAMVQITQYEGDPRNPRFGMPVMYLVTLNDPREEHTGVGLATSTVRVHWSRVIHLADNRGTSEAFGVPRLRPVLNRVLDLRKIYAASAEGYWKAAFAGIALSTHPQLGGDVDVNLPALKDMMENYAQGLDRTLYLMGMQASTIAPSVSDPSSQISVQTEAICIQLGIPVRVFKGSERGELASSQDDDAWNDRLRERQNNYLTPRVIVPFVDRLIQMGILPEPEGYSVEWPDLTSLSESDRANIGNLKTMALSAYVAGGVESLMAPQDYLTRVVGMEEEDATTVLDNARKAHEEEQTLSVPPLGQPGNPGTPKKPPVPPAPVVVQGGKGNPFAKGQPRQGRQGQQAATQPNGQQAREGTDDEVT